MSKKNVETAKNGNPRIYISVGIILILTFFFCWLRNVTQGYVFSYVVRSESAEEATSYNEALQHTKAEADQLEVLGEDWDYFKNSHLWFDAETTVNSAYDGELTLHAALYDCGAAKTVIVFPEFAETSQSDFYYGSAFGEQGFNILLVDFRGTGKSSSANNGFGLTEQEDVLAWISYAKQELGGEVVLYGKGMGANAILYALVNAPEGSLTSVSTAICESPYNDIKEECIYTLKNAYHLPAVFYQLMSGYAKKCGVSYDLNVADASFAGAANVAADNKTLPKVLFLIGEKDDYIPAEYSQASYEAYPGEKELITADVRHNMIYASQKEVIEAAIF